MTPRALAAWLAAATMAPATALSQGQACSVQVALPMAMAVSPSVGSGAPQEDALARAQRFVAQGRMSDAREAALAALESPGFPEDRRALAWSIVALAGAGEGDPRAAASAIERANTLMPAAGATSAAANLHLGWALTELGDVPATRRAFEQAAAASARSGQQPLAALAAVHRALLEGRIGAADVDAFARSADREVARLDERADRARLRVALALALIPESRRTRAGANDALAQSLLNAAYEDASRARDSRSLVHALGLMGELRLLRGESRDAAATLGRAVAAARAAGNDPWSFRWSWKRGVALRASGDPGAALAHYEEGVRLLESAKAEVTLDRFAASSLARGYRRAYLDLADLVLAQPETPERLARAREVMELSRSAEIEDFFRDPCLAERSTRVAEPYRLDPSSALIHPLVFDDRIEILVSHASGVARFTSRVDALSVSREVQRLRVAAEHPGSDRYRPLAQRLHGWLVAPIEPHLRRLDVKTLVWVPDGALRGVPIAALHDGRSHLVERYAVGVTPVATLTDPRPLGSSGVRPRLWGLTVASQGFAALPGVAGELDRVSSLLGVPAVRDEQFSVSALQESLRRSPANTLHIASHGQFAPETWHTFLLAYDGRLTLPELRAALAAGRIREEPVELLVLSACQTAAGDERAALGIAGVAIGSGARSAVATLWSVSDASTATLVERFYRELVAGKGNRAEALRQAQLSLLANAETAHPFYWAPFLMIGNWM